MRKSMKESENFRGLINDLKRRPEDAARELGVPIEKIQAILDGKDELTSELISKAVKIWPVNECDFYLPNDDAPEGVRIMTAAESELTSRVMDRAGRPYYEYRDTAMSRVTHFRPEWIKELCVVYDDDPENPAVQWNNGHFMHQFTYFVGPVNFYFRDEQGKKRVAVMNTGDTMYITPFVPHTFTTRKNNRGEEGLILALTYGDKLTGAAQQELAAIGPDLAEQFSLDFSTKKTAFGSLLRFHRDCATMTLEELARQSELESDYISALEGGSEVPGYATIEKLAEALTIDARDLLPPSQIWSKVVVTKYDMAKRWTFPEESSAYRIVTLAAAPNLPHSKGLELTTLQPTGNQLDLRVGLHQYGYNVGNSPITLHWEYQGTSYSKTMNPGDSLYMKPFVPHNFRGDDGKLLLLRIGGKITGEPQRELSLFDQSGVRRAIGETLPWFNKEGRKDV